MACGSWLSKKTDTLGRNCTMKFQLSKEVQCEIVVCYEFTEQLQVKSGLNFHRRKDYEFEDIFNITEDDVYEYVMQHGFDPRMVGRFDALPDPESNYPEWILLPKTEEGYHLASFNSWDRNLWNEWCFATEEARDRFIVSELLRFEKNFWGKKPVVYPSYFPMPPFQ